MAINRCRIPERNIILQEIMRSRLLIYTDLLSGVNEMRIVDMVQFDQSFNARVVFFRNMTERIPFFDNIIFRFVSFCRKAQFVTRINDMRIFDSVPFHDVSYCRAMAFGDVPQCVATLYGVCFKS